MSRKPEEHTGDIFLFQDENGKITVREENGTRFLVRPDKNTPYTGGNVSCHTVITDSGEYLVLATGDMDGNILKFAWEKSTQKVSISIIHQLGVPILGLKYVNYGFEFKI